MFDPPDGRRYGNGVEEWSNRMNLLFPDINIRPDQNWLTAERFEVLIMVVCHRPVLQAVAIKPDGQQSPPSSEDVFTTPSDGPILTRAEPWGPTTAQATATPPPGVTFTSVSLRWATIWPNERLAEMKTEGPVFQQHDRGLLVAQSQELAGVRELDQHLSWFVLFSDFRLLHPNRSLQYTFTAVPVGGGTPVTVSSIDPDVRFYGLQPNTTASWRACSRAYKGIAENL